MGNEYGIIEKMACIVRTPVFPHCAIGVLLFFNDLRFILKVQGPGPNR